MEDKEEPVAKKEKTELPPPIPTVKKDTAQSNSIPAPIPKPKESPAPQSSSAFDIGGSVNSSSIDRQGTILRHFHDESWWKVLEPQFKNPYFARILKFLNEQKANGKTVYPPEEEIFTAFNLCPFDKVGILHPV